MKTLREILVQLAEETAYSSKGHFKTADWINIALAVYVVIPLATSLLTFTFVLPDNIQRTLSFIGLLFSSLALNSALASNRGKTAELTKDHMELGNQYLGIFKELRQLAGTDFSVEKLDEIRIKVSELDAKSTSAPISIMGRLWSGMRIKYEMNLDWLKEVDKGDRIS